MLVDDASNDDEPSADNADEDEGRRDYEGKPEVDPSILRSDASTWPEILSLDEVAHVLDITLRTARRQVGRGDIPAVKYGSGYRTRKQDLLDAFVPTNVKSRQPKRKDK